jgi:hypothetical protein
MIDSDDFDDVVEQPKVKHEYVDQERLSLKARLDADIENFLKAGGKVTYVEKDLRADPPKRPSMNYGTAPI